MSEHGMLYAVQGSAYSLMELVVKDGRVVRTCPMLRWLRGATLAQMNVALAEHGMEAVAIRAAEEDEPEGWWRSGG
jgi:hypothetical protein